MIFGVIIQDWVKANLLRFPALYLVFSLISIVLGSGTFKLFSWISVFSQYLSKCFWYKFFCLFSFTFLFLSFPSFSLLLSLYSSLTYLLSFLSLLFIGLFLLLQIRRLLLPFSLYSLFYSNKCYIFLFQSFVTFPCLLLCFQKVNKHFLLQTFDLKVVLFLSFLKWTATSCPQKLQQLEMLKVKINSYFL